MAHVSVSALQEQFQRAMFTTSILIFALIAVHAQAFALWVQSIRLTNNRISKSNYGDDITDAVPVFLFLRRSLPDGAQAVGDAFQAFVQKFARTCQVDADEALSRFAVH